MKILYVILPSIFLFFIGNAQVINFADANFKDKLLVANTTNGIATDIYGTRIKIDTNNNAQIEVSEAAVVGFLNLSHDASSGYYGNIIVSLSGISNFSNLRSLEAIKNGLNTLTALQGLPNLENINVGSNVLTTVDLSGLTNQQNIKTLQISANNFSTLNLSSLTGLKTLDCGINGNLTSLTLIKKHRQSNV